MPRTGAVTGLCPVTEANLGDGIFPATRYFGSGGRFGIGTDSNVSISVADELRQLEYSQRLRDRARNVVSGADARSTGRVLFDGGSRRWREGARRGSARRERNRRRGTRGFSVVVRTVLPRSHVVRAMRCWIR